MQLSKKINANHPNSGDLGTSLDATSKYGPEGTAKAQALKERRMLHAFKIEEGNDRVCGLRIARAILWSANLRGACLTHFYGLRPPRPRQPAAAQGDSTRGRGEDEALILEAVVPEREPERER
eukprot:5732530-Pleurochrysis_carterae.AAC.1